MVEVVNFLEVWVLFGVFLMVMIQGDGWIVYLKGQVVFDCDGQVVGVGDMCVQVCQIFGNFCDVLVVLGGQMCDVILFVYYVIDIDVFMQVGDICNMYFVVFYLVMMIIQVECFYYFDLLIEIVVIVEILWVWFCCFEMVV